MLIFIGKVKDMTFKELCLTWYFGRPIELLEDIDFGRN